MSFLKSKFDLCVFELPEDFNPELSDIFNALLKNKFIDIAPASEFADGWANITDLFKPITMEDTVAVDYVVGGYRFDKKNVPNALIKRLYQEKLQEKKKESTKEKITKEIRKQIKEECKSQLLMKTLATPKLLTWVLDVDLGRLYLSSKSKNTVESFRSLFEKTFQTQVKVMDFGLDDEDTISEFLEYMWSNVGDKESEDKHFWINQEVTLDSNKNTFKFNGPDIETYKEEIKNFKQAKKIKSMNLGVTVKKHEYSVTFNNKNTYVSVDVQEKIAHESIETCILDNLDRIKSIVTEIESLVSSFDNN